MKMSSSSSEASGVSDLPSESLRLFSLGILLERRDGRGWKDENSGGALPVDMRHLDDSHMLSDTCLEFFATFIQHDSRPEITENDILTHTRPQMKGKSN